MDKNARGTRIATVDDYGIAGLMVERLRGVGVHAMDVDGSSHVSVAGAESFYVIEIVDDRQVEDARKVLAAWGYQKYLT